MKLTLSLIAIAFSANVFAQTTKITDDLRGQGIKQVYYVLTSDENIKQGPYVLYSSYQDRLICEGTYKNNVRDSVWTSYDYEGKLEVKYDYAQKKLLEYNPPAWFKETAKYNVIIGTDTLKTALDQPPIFVDGSARISRLIGTNLRYPLKAKMDNIQGKVIIAITIDQLGHPVNYRIKKPVGGGCSEAALNAVKMIVGDWIPGALNGKTVTAEFDVPVTFTLQQD